MIRHIFVYGTLRPGDVRWPLLQPFVVDDGWSDTVAGELFDTGLDYPAAIFNQRGTIHGNCLALIEMSLHRALEVLDDIEGVSEGEYARVTVRTARGIEAWAYASGPDLTLTPISSGDWFIHRAL